MAKSKKLPFLPLLLAGGAGAGVLYYLAKRPRPAVNAAGTAVPPTSPGATCPSGPVDETVIRAAQTRLIGLGYSVGTTGADGRMGAHTEAGLRDFQGRQQPPLPVTGQLDDATRAVLCV